MQLIRVAMPLRRVIPRFAVLKMTLGVVFFAGASIGSGNSQAQESASKEIQTPKSLELETPGNPVSPNVSPAAREITPPKILLPQTKLGPANAPHANDPVAAPSATGDKFTQKLIQDALTGKPASANDPMFQDMLDVLRARGSVLKGSMLDTQTAAPIADADPTPQFEHPAQMSDEASIISSQTEPRSEKQFLTAEMLLRTARRLDKMAVASPRRKQLVKQLRQEAVILLREAAKIRNASRP